METLRAWEENVSQGDSVEVTFKVDGRKWIHVEANLSGNDHWLAVFTDRDIEHIPEQFIRLIVV
mgnify:CR=1 FL=1